MKKYLITSAIAVLLSLVLITCKKDVEIVGTNSNKIEIGAIIIDSVSYFSAKINTSISNIGNNKISQHGHCWNKSPNPTIENNKTQLGAITQAADYVSELLNLEDQTKYYIRSYVISGNVIIYGSETTFTTLKTGKPSLTTNEVTEIDNFSAICGGIITTDSGLIINSKGLCWDTTSTFSIEDCLGIVLIDSGIGSFYGNITELSKGKQYYVKAFATNQKGTSYGEVKSFTTTDVNIPIVTTTNANQITTNSAAAGGNVTNDGNLTVTQRGVYWHTNPNPTMENNLGNTTDGSGTGSFVSNINGLTEGQTYYYRAYATNSKGTGYGIIKEFTTTNLELPTVSTNNITNIGITYATGGGNVTNDGNSSVTARGVCWNTSGNPTMQNNLGHTTNGSGTGTFTSSLTGLNENTTYYVAAYATSSEGTAYGSIKSFSTLNISLPTVTTTTPTNITTNSATSGGNVASDGGTPVTSRGVCWNTTGNPTLQNNLGYTANGNGSGNFSSNITGLSENTTYFVAAYASNSEGTSYGSEKTFTTLFLPCSGESTLEYEGQIYNLIEIGTQCWLKENLNVGIRLTSSQIMQNNSIIEKYCYNDVESNCEIYGGIYQWDEMMNYSIQEGCQGICPSGWHIPTYEEFNELQESIGYLDAGGKLKEAGYVHWEHPNTGATNSSNFTALPGGGFFGYWHFIGLAHMLWTSSEHTSVQSWRFYLSYDSSYCGIVYQEKEHGHSVRCIKD